MYAIKCILKKRSAEVGYLCFDGKLLLFNTQKAAWTYGLEWASNYIYWDVTYIPRAKAEWKDEPAYMTGPFA